MRTANPTGRSILWSMTGRMATWRSVASAQARSVGRVRYTSVVPDEVVELLLTEAAGQAWRARTTSADQVGGGRCVTLVIEQTVEPTTWLTITGGESIELDRKLLPDRR
jgi:hypothetical protein